MVKLRKENQIADLAFLHNGDEIQNDSLPDLIVSAPKAKNKKDKIINQEPVVKRGKVSFDSPKSDHIFFFALGGLEHIGQNMYVYKYKGKYLVIDCGMGFLDQDLGGSDDTKYCDTSWLEKHKEDVLGFIITHGHEDHIGALKYVWPKFKCPIYCTRFVHQILSRTFKGMEIEFNDKKDFVVFDHNGATFDVGPFRIETFHVSHSLPEAQMIVINTAAGKILHTGDWTFNEAIPIENPTDYARLREIGSDPKLLAVMCDSTNAPKQEPQVTEVEVSETLEGIMRNAPGRVFVTGYSRSLARQKMFSNAAKATGRTAAIKERSNSRPVPYVGLPEFREIGIELGYLGKDDLLLHRDISGLPAEKQAIYLTGSQGEKYAMLTRLCRGHVRELQLQQSDTVVFSALVIPGRETAISFLYNKLAKMGIKTHTIFDTSKVHASGHAGRPELEKFYDMVHPQVIVPMHGEYIGEMLNGKMAMERGGAKHMMLVKNGEVIALKDGEEPAVVETIKTGFIIMEGETERSGGDQVLRNRQTLFTEGAVFVTLMLDKKGNIKDVSEVSSVGLLESDTSGKLKQQIRTELAEVLKDISKTDKKSKDKIYNKVEMAVKKIVRPLFGDRKSPKVSIHFVSKN